MKILVMNSARKFIGEAAHCLALAAQLRLRGHEAVLGVRRGYELEARALHAGLPVLSLTMSSRFNPGSDLADLFALRRWLREGSFDLVHCHRGKDHWLAAMTPATLVRTRHVVVPMASHALNRWLLAKRTARVIGVSRKAAESFGAMLPSLSPKLTVIYSAVDTEHFRPARRSEEWRNDQGILPDNRLVGMIARIQNVKGQRVFLQAASRVRRALPNVRFLMAGAGTDHKLAALRNRVAEMGLSDCVTVRGWCEDVETVIASLDCGVVAGSAGADAAAVAYDALDAAIGRACRMPDGNFSYPAAWARRVYAPSTGLPSASRIAGTVSEKVPSPAEMSDVPVAEALGSTA